jgi:hypothetical protein
MFLTQNDVIAFGKVFFEIADPVFCHSVGMTKSKAKALQS